MMEGCIYPFERFERLKKWKGYSLAYSFGYSFKLLQKRNVLIAYSFGYSFLCLFCSNKTGKHLFFYLVFIGFYNIVGGKLYIDNIYLLPCIFIYSAVK